MSFLRNAAFGWSSSLLQSRLRISESVEHVVKKKKKKTEQIPQSLNQIKNVLLFLFEFLRVILEKSPLRKVIRSLDRSRSRSCNVPLQSGEKFEIDFASKIKVFVAESHLRASGCCVEITSNVQGNRIAMLCSTYITVWPKWFITSSTRKDASSINRRFDWYRNAD